MFSFLSSSSNQQQQQQPSYFLIGAGIAVIFGAVAIAVISARANNKPAKPSLVHDPYKTTAFMANGSFGKEDSYDTVINIGARFENKKTAPSKEVLMDLFEKHIVPHQQFHCVPRTVPEKSSNIVWEPLTGSKLDLNKHFIEHHVSNIDETMKLMEKISNDSAALRREPNTPWWRVHLIHEKENQQQNSNKTNNNQLGPMMLISVHHCLGDGISLFMLFSKILQSDAKGTPLDMSGFFSPTGRGDPLGGDRGILANILKPWRWPMAILETIDFITCFVVTALHPLQKDTVTCFTQQPWPPQNDAVAIPMPRHSLDLIKKIKNAAGRGVTVNDVEYALYGGMMRRYLLKYGNMTDGAIQQGKFRALVPFAVPHDVPRGREFTHTMANTFSFLVNTLPLSQKSAKDRLIAAHKSWQPAKKRSFVPAAFAAAVIASKLPLSQQQQTLVDLFSGASVVFSNVPGPSNCDMYIAGSKIVEIHTLYPNLIPQVIILSINGEMHYSLMCKHFGQVGRESDCKIALPKLFKEELDELCQAYNVV